MRSTKKVVMMIAVVVLLLVSLGCSKVDVKEANSAKLPKQEITLVTEEVTNSANYKCELLYDSTLKLDMPEADLLAKMADYEGGNDEEKELIMKFIASRKQIDIFPDDIKSIICQKGMFLLNPIYWNSMEAPSEKSVEVAEKILAEGEMCDYMQYDLNTPQTKEWIKAHYPDSETLETENFIFWK